MIPVIVVGFAVELDADRSGADGPHRACAGFIRSAPAPYAERDEGPHRVRSRHADQSQRRVVRRGRRRTRAARLRLALVVGADQCRGAGSTRGDGVRRRAHHPAEVRDVGDGPAGAQPGRARQGTGHAGDDVGRSSPPRVRARRGRPGRAAGVRCRAIRTGGDLRRDAHRHAVGLDGRAVHATTAPASTTTSYASGRHRSGWTSGSAGRRRPSCAGSAGSPTVGCRRSSCPPTSRPGRTVIEAVAAEHDREIEDDHYGVLIPYTFGDIPDQFRAVFAKRRPDDRRRRRSRRRRRGIRLIATIKRFVDVGTSKFVVLPLDEPQRRRRLDRAPRRGRSGAPAPRDLKRPVVRHRAFQLREPNATCVTSNRP